MIVLRSRFLAHMAHAALAASLIASPHRAHAQTQPQAPGHDASLEMSAGYNAIRANAPVGNCGCFYMQGGRADVGIPIFKGISGVAEVGGAYADRINSSGDGVARITYLIGPRLSHHVGRKAKLFGQALFGGAHGFDGYFPSATSSASSADAFAFSAGGGVDVRLSHRLALRALQADYLYTELPNGKGDKQNNLRIGTGLVLRLR